MVHINPSDASRLGIRSGDEVIVYNELGEVVLRAVVTDTVPPGVLWAPRQLTGLNGTPLNKLVPPDKHPVGGGPLFNSAAVSVRLVRPRTRRDMWGHIRPINHHAPRAWSALACG